MKLLHINSYYSTSIFYKNLHDVQKEHGLDIDAPVPSSHDISKLMLGKYTPTSRKHSKYDGCIFYLNIFRF